MADQNSINMMDGIMMSLMGCTLNSFVTQSLGVMSQTDIELHETIQNAVVDEDYTLLNICVAEELNRMED